MTKEEIKKIIKEVLYEESRKVENLEAFKRVELMLKHYNSFKKRIANLQHELDYVVIKKRVNYDVVFCHQYEHLSECEKIELKKEELKENVVKYEKIVSMIDEAISAIQHDKYYNIIPLKYFECYTNEDVAEKLNIDRATYFRNKNRLINELVEQIFPDEILRKIFEKCD